MEKIYNEICIDLMNDFNKLKININNENVHNLRINFKKLKAFYKLFSFVYEDFDFKINFKKNKKLYKILGKHRDNHILSLHINNYIKLNNKNYLIENFLRKNENFKPVISNYKKLNNKNIKNYLNYLFNFINLNVCEEKLHDQRKLIKDFYYISSWFEKFNENENIKKISDYLGEWNDKRNVINVVNVEFFPKKFIYKLEKEKKILFKFIKKRN
jgi:CHAD domain-containing protein